MPDQYTVLAAYYDRLVRADYKKIAAFLDGHIRRALPDASLVLDLACGTGNVTRRLSALGYNMIGADASQEMLAEAAAKPARGAPVLWLNQDMAGFELYGTVDAVVCCLDSLNYLTSAEELARCFALVRNYLNEGGVFIFDLNSRYKFRSVLRNRVDCYSFDDLTCVWRSSYSDRSGVCTHELTFFTLEKGGLYRRLDERQIQKYYSEKTVRELLAANGLQLAGVYADYGPDAPTADTERICFVAQKI